MRHLIKVILVFILFSPISSQAGEGGGPLRYRDVVDPLCTYELVDKHVSRDILDKPDKCEEIIKETKSGNFKIIGIYIHGVYGTAYFYNYYSQAENGGYIRTKYVCIREGKGYLTIEKLFEILYCEPGLDEV